MNRPPDRPCIVIEDIASIAGVRAPIWTIPVARLMVFVRAAGGQRGKRVCAPCLSDEHGAHAESLCFDHELGIGGFTHRGRYAKPQVTHGSTVFSFDTELTVPNSCVTEPTTFRAHLPLQERVRTALLTGKIPV